MKPRSPCRWSAAALVLGAVGLLALARPAAAQRLELQVDSDPIYAAMPFILSVEATDFDEKPEPKVSPLAIDGCRVTPLGVAPNTSRMVITINGLERETRHSSFVYRFRIIRAS